MGVYFPGDRVEPQAMTGVGAPAGKVQPDAHRSPWRRFWPRRRKDGSPSLIDEMVGEAGAADAGPGRCRPRSMPTSPSSPPSGMRMAAVWWCAMAITSLGRC